MCINCVKLEAYLKGVMTTLDTLGDHLEELTNMGLQHGETYTLLAGIMEQLGNHCKELIKKTNSEIESITVINPVQFSPVILASNKHRLN